MSLGQNSQRVSKNQTRINAKSKNQPICKKPPPSTCLLLNTVNVRLKTQIRLLNKIDLNELNIKNKCVACLQEAAELVSIYEELKYLQNNESKKILIVEIMDRILFADIEDDWCLKAICKDCLKLLELVLTFRVQCYSSRATISNYKFKSKDVIETNFEVCESDVDDNSELLTAVQQIDKTKAEETTNKIESNLPNTNLSTCEEAKVDNYKCILCSETYDNKNDYMIHMRTHKGERRYRCKLCEKLYKQSSTLYIHMRAHRGYKPYLCSVCGKAFTRNPDLKIHMRIHSQERPYMCNICGKTMKMTAHLNQHMRTHSGEKPFKCKNCDKAFTSRSYLKRHEIIHTGEKPFTCDVCKKSFNRRSILNIHKRIHTNDRRYACSLCDKSFIQSQSLKIHLQHHFNST